MAVWEAAPGSLVCVAGEKDRRLIQMPEEQWMVISKELGLYGTPEARALFDDWASRMKQASLASTQLSPVTASKMKDEKRNLLLVDGSTEPSSRAQAQGLAEVPLSPSLWGQTTLHYKIRQVNARSSALERHTTRHMAQSYLIPGV